MEYRSRSERDDRGRSPRPEYSGGASRGPRDPSVGPPASMRPGGASSAGGRMPSRERSAGPTSRTSPAPGGEGRFRNPLRDTIRSGISGADASGGGGGVPPPRRGAASRDEPPGGRGAVEAVSAGRPRRPPPGGAGAAAAPGAGGSSPGRNAGGTGGAPMEDFEERRRERREREYARDRQQRESDERRTALATAETPVRTEVIQANKIMAVSMYVRDDDSDAETRRTITKSTAGDDVQDSEVSEDDVPPPPPPLPPLPTPSEVAPSGGAGGGQDFRLSGLLPSSMRKRPNLAITPNAGSDSAGGRRPSATDAPQGSSGGGGGDRYGLANKVANGVRSSPTTAPRPMPGGGAASRRTSIATASDSDNGMPPPPPLPGMPNGGGGGGRGRDTSPMPQTTRPRMLGDAPPGPSVPPSPHSDLTVPDTPAQRDRFNAMQTAGPDAPTLKRRGGPDSDNTPPPLPPPPTSSSGPHAGGSSGRGPAPDLRNGSAGGGGRASPPERTGAKPPPPWSPAGPATATARQRAADRERAAVFERERRERESPPASRAATPASASGRPSRPPPGGVSATEQRDRLGPSDSDRALGVTGGPPRKDVDVDDSISVVSGASRVTDKSRALMSRGGGGGGTSVVSSARGGFGMSGRSDTGVSLADPETQKALADSRVFMVLRADDIERYRRELRTLRSKSEQLTAKLATEIKVKESANQLLRMHRDSNEEVAAKARKQVHAATEKVERILAELLKYTKRVGDLEKRLAQSAAGLLGRAVADFETSGGGNGGSTAPRRAPGSGIPEDTPSAAVANAKVLALEAKVASLSTEAQRADKQIAAAREAAELKAQAAAKLAAEVSDYKQRAEEDNEALVERDRTIAGLRTELEEATVKLEILQTKQGLTPARTSSIGGARSRSRSRDRGRARDFASDSGVEPFDDSRTAASADVGASTETRAMIRDLRDQLAREKGRSAALEAEMSMQPDPRQSRPEMRSAVNASMRDAILERERAKSELEDERIKRRELERRLEELTQSGGAAAAAAPGSPRSPGGGFGERVLRRQLEDARSDADEIKRLRDTDMRTLRRLYDTISPSNTPLSPTRFSLDQLATRVERVVRDKEELLDRVLDLQQRNETMQMKMDTLRSSPSSSAAARAQVDQLDEMESRMLRAQRDLKANERALQDALRDVSRLSDKNQDYQGDVDRYRTQLERYRKDLLGMQDEYDVLLRQSMARGNAPAAAASAPGSPRMDPRQVADLEAKLKAATKDLDAARRDVDVANADLTRQKREHEASVAKLRETMDRAGGSSRQEVSRMQFELEELRDAVSKKESQLRKREADLAEARVAVKAAQDEADATRAQLRDQAADYDLERTRVKRQMSDLSRELGTLRQEQTGKVDQYANQAKESSVQVNKLKASLERTEAELRAAEDKLKQTAASADEFERQVVRLKASLDRLQSARDEDLRDHEANLDRMRKGMEADMSVLKKDLEDKDRQVEVMRGDLQRTRGELDRVQEAHEQQMGQTRAALQTQLDALNKEYAEKEKILVRLQDQHEKLKAASAQELRDAEDRLVRKTQQVSAELQDALAKLDEEVAERKRKVRELEDAMTDLQHRYEDDMSAYERELSGVQNSADSQASQLEALKRQITVLEQEKASAKDKLTRLGEARDADRAAHDRVVDELRAKLGDAEGIDFAQHRALQEQVAAMEEQLAHTFEKFAKREDQLSGELEKLQEREKTQQQEYEGILKEFDRLAGNFTDFEGERKKLERVIAAQRTDMAELKAKCEEMTVNQIGDNDKNPTVVNLRKEFRKILADIREEYSGSLNREIDEKSELEKTIRALKREKEMEAYHKSSTGVQTLSLYTEKQPMTLQRFASTSDRFGSPAPHSPRSLVGGGGGGGYF
ncbi:hypothetical protein BC828DRAFT_262396 [Blastocladiella britannica]|nr:hypothetical protein BC828DRAFT_262396 [Blastocladiella britannica]